MKIAVSFILLHLWFLTNAQPPTKFYNRFGGNGYDTGYDVKQTLDNGYIITGSTSSFGQGNTDLYLVKLDSMGQKKIETSFGNYNNETGRSVVQLIDSSYVMVGYTNSTGFGGYDVFIVKANKDGGLLWQKTIGGSDWDFGYSLQQTTDGGFIIAGTTYSYGRGNADGYVVKTDANGIVTWSKTYGGKKDDEFKSVIQTVDGNYALTGYTKSYNDTITGDVWTFKLDINGDSIWSKFYGGIKEDIGSSIIQLQNSELLVSGGSNSTSTGGNKETLLLTYDNTTGAQNYNYIDVSSQEEYYNGVAQGINGNIANCGVTKNSVFGYDALVDIYSVTFGYVNFFSKGSTAVEEFYAISKTKDKGFVAVGKTNGFNAVLDDVFFMKMDSTGSYGPSIISVNETKKENILPLVYPNPCNGILNIFIKNVSSFENLNFQISDISGRIVYSGKIEEQSTSINTSFISSGLYFMQLYSNTEALHSSKISVIK